MRDTNNLIIIKSTSELKKENFKRVITGRLHKTIDRLSIMGTMTTNMQHYEFSEEDILKVFEQIEKYTEVIKQRFLNEVKIKEVGEDFKIHF